VIEAIGSAEVFKTMFKALSLLVSEARFHFKDEGIHVRTVDPANVAMILIDIPREGLEAYMVEEERTVGVSINRLLDILKQAKKRDSVELKVGDNNISVKFGSLEYSVALIEPDAIRKGPKMPELDLPAKIVLSADEFRRAIQMADKVSDQVVLRCDESGFYLEAEGDVDKITFHMGEMELIEFNKAEARAMFSIEYLKEFVKIASAGDVLTIYLGTDLPVRLQFDLVDEKLKVEYILAPRVENA